LISWISGELLELWQANNKFFILINCQGLGYEIQIIEPFFVKLKTNQSANKNIILWIKHIKKEESDLLFGFESKDQKKFFIEILSIRGIGSQIGISILNKLSIPQIINAIKTQNKKEICSIPGIGQKMTERLILELNNKFKKEIEIKDKKNIDDFEIINPEINQMLDDLQLTLQSLNYTKNEIKRILPIIIKETYSDTKKNINTSFEDLLKLAMNYLENDSSNLVI
jgi:Holliday junction DNA helicase RuvA